jgi:hypothetical protein
MPVRGPFVADGGCRGHRLGRAMMRRAQKPSLHMAIRGPDRRQAFRGCTRLRRNHRVMGVSVVGMPRNRCGRKARRCHYQTTKCNPAHVLASSMGPAPGCHGRPTIRGVQGQSSHRPTTRSGLGNCRSRFGRRRCGIGRRRRGRRSCALFSHRLRTGRLRPGAWAEKPGFGWPAAAGGIPAPGVFGAPVPAGDGVTGASCACAGGFPLAPGTGSALGVTWRATGHWALRRACRAWRREPRCGARVHPAHADTPVSHIARSLSPTASARPLRPTPP